MINIDSVAAKVYGELDELEHFTPWNENHDNCRDCPQNFKDDHCQLLDKCQPHECPQFEEQYSYSEVNPDTHLEMLLAFEEILLRRPFMMNGKKYQLREVENISSTNDD